MEMDTRGKPVPAKQERERERETERNKRIDETKHRSMSVSYVRNFPSLNETLFVHARAHTRTPGFSV